MALAAHNMSVTDELGNALANVVIEVRLESSGALATLYSDRDGLVLLGNSFTASDGKHIIFYVNGGSYKITATKDGLTQTWRYVAIGLASENDVDDILATVTDNYHYKNLLTSPTGANVSTAQPWFPTAGAVTLASNKAYRVEGYIYLIRAAGTTSHTTSILFGGTATVSLIVINALANTGDTGATEAIARTPIVTTAGAVVKGVSTSATEQVTVRVFGTIRIGTGGTLIPQFKYSAAPGGAPTIVAGSFFELTEIGADTDETAGTWS